MPVGEGSATTLGAASDVTVQLALIFLRMVSPALVLSGLTPRLFYSAAYTIFLCHVVKNIGRLMFFYS